MTVHPQDSAIDAARRALADLNRALAVLATYGVEAKVHTIETACISEPAPRATVTINLVRTKTEIDITI